MNVIGRLPVRTKLALVMTLLLAATSVAVYLYFPVEMERQVLHLVIQKSAGLTEMAAHSMGRGLSAHDPAAVAEALTAMRRNPDLLYLMVLDRNGASFAAFNEMVASQSDYRSIRMNTVNESLRLPRGGAPPMRRQLESAVSGGASADGAVYQTFAPVRYQGRRVGSLFLGVSLDRVHEQTARSRATIAMVTAVAFLLCTAAVFALSTFITGPLKRMVETAEQITAGDLSRRAPVGSSDEMGQLARAFNVMIDRMHTAWTELELWGRTLESRVEARTRELQDEVDERRRAEEALRRTEERYRLLFERNLAAVYIASEDGRILSCNNACARLFGYTSPQEFLQDTGAGGVPYMHRHDRDSILRRLREDGAVMNEEVELCGRGGESIWVLENVRMIHPDAAGAASLEGIVLDITDRRRSEEEIEFKAFHDELTRLPNRSLFLDRLEIALAQAQRNNAASAVMFIDLDDMKVINDTLGHATGDSLLKLVADRLSRTLRLGDTVARVGGDEFLVLLAQISGEADAVNVAEKIQAALADGFFVNTDELQITASTGVALYPGDGATAEQLIRHSDGAMYRVKERGGNSFELCSRSGRGGPGRLSLEQQIRTAIERDELTVYYQPQVAIATRALSGAEALVRWNHPDGTLVEPAGFIPVAEQSGLIAPLGELVLRKACQQMVAWQSEHDAPERMAVNVSARQFYQRDLPGMIARVLAETRLDPARLEIEITESVAMHKTDRSLRMLRQLREMGISVAIDDFGTGQSSLAYLKRFAIDTVKIDKSFVRDLDGRASDEWIVTAVLLLAKQLGLRTVAEGVESEAQCAVLAKHGCTDIQGFLISRPIPPRLFAEQFLISRRALVLPQQPTVL